MIAVPTGNAVALEQVIRGEDHLAIEVDAGQRPGRGTRREDQRVAGELGHVRAAVRAATRDPHQARRDVDDGSGTRDHGHLAPLEQGLETLRQPIDHLLLAHQARGEVERRLARVDPELLRVAHRPQHLGGLQQLLRRDAASVQAGAADPGLLDHGDPEAGGGAVERGGVPTGPTAQHHDVEVLSHGAHRLAFPRPVGPDASKWPLSRTRGPTGP